MFEVNIAVQVEDSVRPAATVQDGRVFVKAADGNLGIPISISKR